MKTEDQARRIAECLKRGTTKVISENEEEIFRIKPPAKEVWGPDHIFDMKVDINSEIGEKFHRVHVHAFISITHDTLIQMDSKVLRQLLIQECQDEGVKNLFIRVRYVPETDLARLYIFKDPFVSTT